MSVSKCLLSKPQRLLFSVGQLKDNIASDDELVLATLTCDGLGRRIGQYIENCVDWDAMCHYYYNDQGIIETRNGSDFTLNQYVWGLA